MYPLQLNITLDQPAGSSTAVGNDPYFAKMVIPIELTGPTGPGEVLSVDTVAIQIMLSQPATIPSYTAYLRANDALVASMQLSQDGTISTFGAQRFGYVGIASLPQSIAVFTPHPELTIVGSSSTALWSFISAVPPAGYAPIFGLSGTVYQPGDPGYPYAGVA